MFKIVSTRLSDIRVFFSGTDVGCCARTETFVVESLEPQVVYCEVEVLLHVPGNEVHFFTGGVQEDFLI